MSFGETAMTDQIVATDAPDLCTQLLKFLMGITESAGLGSAARGFVLGIEEKHQGCAVALADGAAVAFVVLQVDGRNAVTNGEGHDEESDWWRNLRQGG